MKIVKCDLCTLCVFEKCLKKTSLYFINEKLGGNEKPGGNYLAIHWRYDSDWLFMCIQSRRPYARRQNSAICKMVNGLTYDIETEELFLMNINNLMLEHNLKYIYMSTTPNNKDLLKLVKEAFGKKLFHLEDVHKLSNSTFYPGFLRNNYFSSFVEQEICVKSRYFMASGLSSWTQTVLLDRLAKGNFNHSSALLALGTPNPDPPGYPPVLFQFPEGWFKFSFPIDSETGLYYRAFEN